MISKLWKWLAILGGFATSILTVLWTRSQLKNTKQKLEHAEAESEALSRHSEGLIAGQEKFDEITDTQLDRDHFSRVRKYPGGGEDSNT